MFSWTADEAHSFAVLDACCDAGGNVVGTADAYMYHFPGSEAGQSETIIGKWFAARSLPAS